MTASQADDDPPLPWVHPQPRANHDVTINIISRQVSKHHQVKQPLRYHTKGSGCFLFHGSLSSIHRFTSGSVSSMYPLIGFSTLISQRRSRLIITLNSPIYLKSQLQTEKKSSLSLGMHYAVRVSEKIKFPSAH